MNYKNYAKTFNASDEVIYWIEHNLSNYLSKNKENQDEIEHIIDYLISDKAPKRLRGMSYKEALSNSKKWTKSLIKKGGNIKESIKDTEVVLDFKDGFKIVRLVGENAYKREGYLMRHCVGSYYGQNVEVYSLRDKDNMPHCTMEKDKQIKGKGNGNIHPKYINYVIKFLEHIKMTVGDNEMLHLGYINVSKIKKYLHKDTKYINKVYVPDNQKLLDKKGNEFASLELLDSKPLIKEDYDKKLKINFELPVFIKKSIEFLFNKSKISSGDYSKLALSGDYSQLTSSGYYSQLASSGGNSKLASSGDYSKLASSGYYSQLASSGGNSQLASSGGNSKLASSGYYSQLASSGDYSKLASSGDYSKLEINGKDSIGANIGINGMAKGKKGNWITLAEYDKYLKPICVKSAKIDGKKLKENVWYKLKNKKFVESLIN